MELKYCLLFLVMLFGTIYARPRRTLPANPACFCTMATPYPAVIEAIDYTCSSCSCQTPVCNDQLILPPLAAELPCGLGYFRAALPLVGKYYEPAIDCLTTGAYLPISSGCNGLTLAAPISPDWAPLVKPIIL